MGIASTPSLGLSTNANGGLVGPVPFWDEGRNVPSPQPGSVVTGADGAKYILAKATGVIPPNTNVILTEPAMTVAAGAGDWYSQNTAIPINNYAWFRASIQGVGVVPSEPSEFSMAQLASAQRIYQRSSKTGGGQNVGRGAIPVILSVTKAGAVYARCRSAADGTTILQPSWFVTNAVVANGPLSVTGIDARPDAFFLDLSPDGTTWQNGTVAVSMGRLIALSGQSQAVRQVAKVPAYAGTMASLGVTISPNSKVYAAIDDSLITIANPAWAAPSDAGPYTSTFTGEFLRRQVEAFGVACGLVGYAKGDTAIAEWASGTAQRNKLLSILDAVGGFEAFYWHQGGNDAGAGTAKATYKSALDDLFADIASHNPVWGGNFTKVVTAMATRLSGGAGTAAQVQTIRQAAKEWAAANGGIYLEPHDIVLEDNVHQGQPGSITLANHAHRALASNDIGPTMGIPSRAAGSAIIAVPVTLPSGASTLVLTGSAETRFSVFPSGQTTGALTVSSISWDNTLRQLSLTLSAAPADSQALDVYAFRHPDPSGSGAFAHMIRDDRTSDGISVGRSLEPSTDGPVICPAAGAATAPAQMSAPTLSSGNGTIAVTRAADPSNGGSAITGYDLRYSTDQSTWNAVAMSSNPQTITGLANGTLYYVQTRANNAIGNGAWSLSATATPSAGTVTGFSDTFTDTNGVNLAAHTSDSGHSWTAVAGAILIDSNDIYGSTVPATYRSSYVPASADAFVQATFTAKSIVSGSANWLLARSTAVNNWYQGGYQPTGGSGAGWYIGKTVGGTFTQLGYAAASLPAGESRVVRLEVQGSTIRLLVDAVEVRSVTDTSITGAGNIGARRSGGGVDSATTGIHIDTMTAGSL